MCGDIITMWMPCTFTTISTLTFFNEVKYGQYLNPTKNKKRKNVCLISLFNSKGHRNWSSKNPGTVRDKQLSIIKS